MVAGDRRDRPPGPLLRDRALAAPAAAGRRAAAGAPALHPGGPARDRGRPLGVAGAARPRGRRRPRADASRRGQPGDRTSPGLRGADHRRCADCRRGHPCCSCSTTCRSPASRRSTRCTCMARRAGDARLLVLGTLRTEEGQEALSRLGDLAERSTSVRWRPRPSSPSRRQPGSATLALEHRRADRRSRAVRRRDAARACAKARHGVPATLTDAVTHRVARTGHEVEELARAAAVLGASFEPGTVAGLLELTDAVAARRCEQLVSARLAVESGRTYEFVNDLVHEVLYATTPEPTRHTYHRAGSRPARGPTRTRCAARSGVRSVGPGGGVLAGRGRARRVGASPCRTRNGCSTRALTAALEADAPELVLRAHLERGRVRETRRRLRRSHERLHGGARPGAGAGPRTLADARPPRAGRRRSDRHGAGDGIGDASPGGRARARPAPR